MDRRQRLWLLQSRVLTVNNGPSETLDAWAGAWAGDVSLLDGQPASPGRVVGRARRLADIALIRPGDVLVASNLPAGLAALLPQVGGLVLENAGSTAHAATLVRERGIPAVFGVNGASRAIAEGSLVCVDGTAGRVEYHPVR
jgi:rifampicin phosphotransferase